MNNQKGTLSRFLRSNSGYHIQVFTTLRILYREHSSKRVDYLEKRIKNKVGEYHLRDVSKISRFCIQNTQRNLVDVKP